MARSKWNRKRKAEERAAKSGKDPRDKADVNAAGYKLNQDYSVAKTSNPRMEAYYSLLGLHSTRFDAGAAASFVPCLTDEEKTAERDRFMSSLRAILPASFRIDRSLDASVQNKLIREMKEFVGKETEVEIELPTRSDAVGGKMNLMNTAHAQSDTAPQQVGGDNPVVTTIKRKIAPAKPIPFISATDSDGSTLTLGYQLSVDRRTLRRNPSLSPLHEWLKTHTDCGHITRQETVSMIPPVVLDVKPGMAVLDMCAAPGSKTCQLVEVVGGFANRDESDGNDGESGRRCLEPDGYVIANDADAKRAYMLVTQLRRLQSPSVFVTSCDGQYFPILDAKDDRGTEKEGMFHRVLCDVPCSGDGTVRKNPGIWRHWNQNGALALHPLQLSIALRGARVTRLNGYMVYSTCSMNPMENESVVAELLRITNGSLVLEDPRPRMEGLIARPGWSTWKVLREEKRGSAKAKKDHKKKNSPKMIAKRKEWAEKRENGECHSPPKERQDPNNAEEDHEEISERSPYHTLPYIAPESWDETTLRERTTSLGFVEYNSHADVEPEWRRRIKPLSRDATERMNQMARESRGGIEVDAHVNREGGNRAENNDVDSASNVDKSDDTINGENDVTMIEESEVEQTGDEPKNNSDNLEPHHAAMEEEEEELVQKAPSGKVGMNHNKQKKKADLSNEDFIPLEESIWPPIVDQFGLSPDIPKEQYMARASGEAKVLYFISKAIKEQLIDRGIQNRITVINSGLKAFERCSIQDARAKYRISQEGVQFVVPHMTKRLLVATADDFYKCITGGFIEFNVFSDVFHSKIKDLEPGSFVVALEGHEHDLMKKLFLVMWKRKNALECFVTKVEIDGIVSKLRALGFVSPMASTLMDSSSHSIAPAADESGAVQ
ncbi:hypothetical protein HJC23_001334 [Cyclotella cryptica]|uniref:SAM-dependent MTase RsmB/NOP-type domain-containing protein n=1 Tax=Cyclotella cryptica TaxID=29204 RepID=A0ABD3NXL1_9STRA